MLIKLLKLIAIKLLNLIAISNSLFSFSNLLIAPFKLKCIRILISNPQHQKIFLFSILTTCKQLKPEQKILFKKPSDLMSENEVSKTEVETRCVEKILVWILRFVYRTMLISFEVSKWFKSTVSPCDRSGVGREILFFPPHK